MDDRETCLVSAVRADAVAEYKMQLVAALREDGALVRRLLADEIEAGKWDGAPVAR